MRYAQIVIRFIPIIRLISALIILIQIRNLLAGVSWVYIAAAVNTHLKMFNIQLKQVGLQSGHFHVPMGGAGIQGTNSCTVAITVNNIAISVLTIEPEVDLDLTLYLS